MAEVARRVVGLNVDASHLMRAGEDTVDAIARLAPHVATARIRDATRGVEGPGPVDRQIPGNGDLDVAALAGAIAALPRPRYAVLEIVGTKEMPLDGVDRVVRTSQQRLVQLFARRQSMPLRVGVIGTGNIGRIHSRMYSSDPLAELVAVCDTVREKADAFAEQFGARAYYSVDEMLKDAGLDL